MTTPDPEAEASPLRVLVVGADEAAAAFLVDLLGRTGFDASTAPLGGAAATTNAATPPFDVVLVDGSSEAVRSIRSLADPPRARTPVVVLAAEGADDHAEAETMGVGATAWIPRPVDDSQLISVLQRVAGR